MELAMLVLLGPSPRWALHGQGPLDRWKSHLAQGVLSIDSRRGEGSPALKKKVDNDTAESPGDGIFLIFTNFKPKAPCSSYFWYPHVVGYMSTSSMIIKDVSFQNCVWFHAHPGGSISNPNLGWICLLSIHFHVSQNIKNRICSGSIINP